MKFKKIRKNIDQDSDIRIWLDDELVFEDAVFNCPKKFDKYKLIKPENNENSEALCPYIYYDKNGKLQHGLRITLTRG